MYIYKTMSEYNLSTCHFGYIWYLVCFVKIIEIYICIWFVKNKYLQFQLFTKNEVFTSNCPILLFIISKLFI